MFSNKFNTRNDPLLEAVQGAMQDGDLRRQAQAQVNEAFGVYNRNAVVRENLAAYDAALEEAYNNLKEGWEGSKKDRDEDAKLAKKHGMTMDQWEKSAADKKHDAKEKMDEAKLAKKDYDKDGKIESPKDEVWGSRLRAAKMAGKLKEEEQIDEISRDTLKSYVKKADRQANNLERKVERRKDRPGEEDKMYKRIEGANLARKKMGVRVAATEETQLDELHGKGDLGKIKGYHEKEAKRAYKKSDKVSGYDKQDALEKKGEHHSAQSQRASGLMSKLKPKSDNDDKLSWRTPSKGLVTRGSRKGKPYAGAEERRKIDIKYALGKHPKPNLPEETDYSAQDRAPVTKSPKGYEDPSTPKVPYSELPKTQNRAGAVIDSAKGALKEAQLDEISNKVRQSYIEKAGKDVEEKRKAGFKKGFEEKKGKKAETAREGMRKRIHGMAKALKTMDWKKVNEEQVDEAAYSAKAARAGKDIGKPGKEFAKIAAKAGKRYGSKERGEAVAGAVLKRIRAKHMEESNLQELSAFGQAFAAAKGKNFTFGGKEYSGARADSKPAASRPSGPQNNPGLRGATGFPTRDTTPIATRSPAQQQAKVDASAIRANKSAIQNPTVATANPSGKGTLYQSPETQAKYGSFRDAPSSNKPVGVGTGSQAVKDINKNPSAVASVNAANKPDTSSQGAGTTFAMPKLAMPKLAMPKLNEEVEVGDNKYRIV